MATNYPLNPVTVYGVDANGNLQPLSVSTAGIAQIQNQAHQGSLTERSGSIALGGTSQQLMAANSARTYLLIQNPATTAGQGVTAETLFIRFGATGATVNTGTSIELVAGGSYEMAGSFVSTQAVQVIAATTAHKFIASEG